MNILQQDYKEIYEFYSDKVKKTNIDELMNGDYKNKENIKNHQQQLKICKNLYQICLKP